MKVLLDTNIIIHREASTAIHDEIGLLFYWLDKLKYQKCIHNLTLDEISKHQDEKTRKSLQIKLTNYNVLKTQPAFTKELIDFSNAFDKNENDKNDTRLLNEILTKRVDILITEDKRIHEKAKLLHFANQVFFIHTFLRRVIEEHPELIDYKILSVRKKYFGNLDLNDVFFASFKEDYLEFDKWFTKKADETAYICENKGVLCGFLYLKIEDENENYTDLEPPFSKKKRLKVGTFKVTMFGHYLGERFLKIIFDNAVLNRVQEIYVTIFDKRTEQKALILLLEEWGFKLSGVKKSSSGEEKVYVRDFTRLANRDNPKLTFPFVSKSSDMYIVPIYPEYHTELFPDSILKTESSNDFIENEPHRNAMSKVYISHSYERNLKSGDIVVFYRTGGIYKGVATTIGLVENVVSNITDGKHLIKLCKRRSVFPDDQLLNYWERYPKLKPFIVNFLYVYSFPKRPNLKKLLDLGVIADLNDMPRGFRKIPLEHFLSIIKESESDESIIVD